MALPLVACGDDVPEGTTEISFWYDATITANKYYEELARTYNGGQGKIDGVYVRPELTGGISTGARPYLTKDSPNVMTIAETVFKDFAIDGLYADLTEYYENDKEFYNENDVPAGVANRYRFTRNAGGISYAGEGQKLVGLPFGSAPYVVLYNKKAFNAYNINIVSCEEENLKAQYPSLQPHGYAEYLNSPFDGAVSSTNLAGETVYKVFNNRIPMNWEEMRYLAKCFTKTKNDGKGYNPTSPTAYGYVSEWWFNYAWSVGGDCVGYNGEKYEFTLGDKTPNYLVTAKDGVTVGSVHYAAGETVRYEDKVKLTSTEGLYELPSTYTAIAEINRFPIPEGKSYDEGVPGYGISYPDSTDRVTAFTSELAAMATLGGITLAELDRNMRGNYDIAPCQQYREYVGGSVYYDGEETFANEYLKVIGKDGYTGALKTADGTENGTPVQGNIAACSESPALVVPKNSDPQKYEASWKFIRWAAGPDGQKILAQTGVVPNQTSVAFSDDYLKTRTDINLYARSLTAIGGDIGDWAYFQNGNWVKGWSGDFNDEVRFGNMAFADFFANKKSAAETAINGMKIVMKGRY
ncbi:MAG: extracellular solute-binding protein [Clostridia bacterium]|nr:extracellular solute-binding protein [Clostridia bacterium]